MIPNDDFFYHIWENVHSNRDTTKSQRKNILLTMKDILFNSFSYYFCPSVLPSCGKWNSPHHDLPRASLTSPHMFLQAKECSHLGMGKNPTEPSFSGLSGVTGAWHQPWDCGAHVSGVHTESRLGGGPRLSAHNRTSPFLGESEHP